jgi:hypothetical protein
VIGARGVPPRVHSEDVLDLVFRSKIDLWLVALVAAVPVLLLAFALEGTGFDDRLADLASIAAVVLVLLIFTALYFTTSYTITPDALLVKSGPFSWIVPLREISSIEPTRSPASAPALSLDRLLIRYGGDELIVSPADKAGFMSAIKRQLDAVRTHP